MNQFGFSDALPHRSDRSLPRWSISPQIVLTEVLRSSFGESFNSKLLGNIPQKTETMKNFVFFLEIFQEGRMLCPC